ncbi:MAG: molybdenum cofactor biosynthesis protein MoaE [Gemmatimonadaceae bacterium]|nr:molybdenum cofactor biosynthesis protein MoaE [Gemmatimonadaceae bacterium]
MIGIRLVHEAIEPGSLIKAVSGADKGAISLFLGTVREMNDGRAVAALRYSAYSEMAETELLRIADEMRDQFGVTTAVIEHRLGDLEIGDIAIGIAVAHAHRAPAIAAVAYAMDEIKRRVPIWKEEAYTDGTKEWVDPTAASVTK